MSRARLFTVVREPIEVELRFSLRPPQPGDLRKLMEAEAVCFPDPWPPQFFISEMLAEGRFNRLLVDQAGELAAYLFCAWQYLDLHVLKVGTLPPLRRRGLGARLMQLAEEHAQEMGGESLTLEVRTGNRPAIGLYERLGYEEVGLRRKYYTNGDDAVIMTKRISGQDPRF